jgi:hypothetical protein
MSHDLRSAVCLVLAMLVWSCGGQSSPTPAAPAPASPPSAAAAQAPDDADPADDKFPMPTARAAVALAALLPSNATGCAPGARCIRVSNTGQPQASGTSIAQCRGEFADFIVPANTIPTGYSGPWFTPNLIENAHTGIPTGTRPWRNVDPRVANQRLAYLLALRNYAFSSPPVRNLTPQLTADTDYFDSTGGTVPANQRAQSWYPAPRMIYGNPSQPGTREAAHGMTLERRVGVGELGGNTGAFGNYAVAYYDARGARTYARVWSTATAGADAPNLDQMHITASGMVFKLLFSAAKPSDFPQDLLAGSVSANILPNGGGPAVAVRLLQIDVAVKDNRAGPTGWYFGTYAFDRNAAGNSPWLKMIPLGLMWGNDPAGPPLQESWINPSAPAYAAAHLGVDGRLNGPVDNPASACMSCHGTAQAPSLANMIPPATGTCASERAAWFRNLPGTQAFGRFEPGPSSCLTSVSGITLTAADYSLQLASTVTRTMRAPATFNPCTWDNANPPAVVAPSVVAAGGQKPPRIFEVTRDP